MADVLTAAQRSFNMSRIRSKDTTPERVVRSLVHGLGFRFRLHVRGLPGRPDLVFPRLRKVIFVHGCFWHLHRCREGQVRPKTNARFWADKRAANRERDRRNIRRLRAAGWQVLVIWECWLKEPEANVLPRVSSFLNEIPATNDP
jgi:DNA mismatch endonuclease (patch repair protein)